MNREHFILSVLGILLFGGIVFCTFLHDMKKMDLEALKYDRMIGKSIEIEKQQKKGIW